MKHLSLLAFVCFLINSITFSQVNILNANLNEYNVSKTSLSQITISNIGSEAIVRIEVSLVNSGGELLIKGVTSSVKLKSGVNILGAQNLQFLQFNFSSTPQGNYINKLHRLPSGAFNHCVNIIPVSGLEEGDEFCQVIDANTDNQLFLINPIDEEVISTPIPMLLWFHSEPFNVLSPGEFFRMTLVKLNENQKPSEGVISNVPIFVKNYLTKHQVQYPFDAEKLEAGNRYGWIVQKIGNGNILASTEAWEFKLEEKLKPEDHMYVDLKTKLDGTIYKVQNDRIFFKYGERYKSKTLSCRIYTDTRQEIKVKSTNEQNDGEGAKAVGYNSYELDIEPYDLKEGYYTLEVTDEKKKVFLLKFYIEQ